MVGLCRCVDQGLDQVLCFMDLLHVLLDLRVAWHSMGKGAWGGGNVLVDVGVGCSSWGVDFLDVERDL